MLDKKIEILNSVLPQYGDVLIAIGAILVDKCQDLSVSDIEDIKDEFKNFLISKIYTIKNTKMLSNSLEFNQIMLENFGVKPVVCIINNAKTGDERVNIYLHDFFIKSVWPILVRNYIDNITNLADFVKMNFIIKQNAINVIYGKGNSNQMFSELKQFLLYNYMVISKVNNLENGDLKLEVMIPIATNGFLG